MKRPDIPLNASAREVLEACGGWYTCPKDATGKRLGPLVGYAGTYDDGGEKRQHVGDDFADYAMIEQWPAIAQRFVIGPLIWKIDELSRDFGITVFCGAPEGGKSIALQLALSTGLRYGYPEKIEDADIAPVLGERLPTKLAFGRHRIKPGDRAALIEDVCNNFSTTLKLIREIEAAGGIVVYIACFLNRSVQWHDTYEAEGSSWPVIALWDEAMPQYRQDDPFVLEDMHAKNFFPKPKPRIAELQAIMAKAAA